MNLTMTSTGTPPPTTTAATGSLVNPLEKKQSSIEWLQTLELGYMMGGQSTSSSTKKNTLSTVSCFYCGKKSGSTTTIKLSSCSKCHVAAYCSRDCQTNDWKVGGHKRACPTYSRVSSHIHELRMYYKRSHQQQPSQSQEGEKVVAEAAEGEDAQKQTKTVEHSPKDEDSSKAEDQEERSSTDLSSTPSSSLSPPTLHDELQTTLRDELFGRIRFYACPYAVFKNRQLGKGFLFLQSDRTLLDMSYGTPKDGITGLPFASDGNSKSQNRAILIHYLTLGEFDAELCREDFELYHIRNQLQHAVDTYDPEKQLVLLCRFRDGHMAVGIAVLVPDYRICEKLGQDYFADNDSGALQLNLDDL